MSPMCGMSISSRKRTASFIRSVIRIGLSSLLRLASSAASSALHWSMKNCRHVHPHQSSLMAAFLSQTLFSTTGASAFPPFQQTLKVT